MGKFLKNCLLNSCPMRTCSQSIVTHSCRLRPPVPFPERYAARLLSTSASFCHSTRRRGGVSTFNNNNHLNTFNRNWRRNMSITLNVVSTKGVSLQPHPTLLLNGVSTSTNFPIILLFAKTKRSFKYIILHILHHKMPLEHLDLIPKL